MKINMNTKINNWIVHPILLSAYPVLFYYSHNIGQLKLNSIAQPLSTTIICSLFGWWFLRLMLKDWRRSGGIVSLFLMLFFSYGHVKTNFDLQMGAYILPAGWIFVLLVGSFAIIKSKKKFVTGTKILNVISIVLIMIVTTKIGTYHIMSSNINQKLHPANMINSHSVNKGKQKQNQYPDIYFIVLDAYARKDILKEIYDFDNFEFLEYLTENNFYVADQATANYCQTGLSFGSTLNFTYLNEWVKEIGENSLSREYLNYIIENNQAVTYMKKFGYKIIAFASTRPETEIKNADVFLNSGITINEFHAGLRNATPLPEMAGEEKKENVFMRYRKHAHYIFDNLSKVALEHQGPKFVFAHIELPHPPFVFGPNGEAIQLESRFNDHDGNWLIRQGRLTKEQYIKHYRDQVIFTNKQMKRTINGILSNSSQPPIILIFGDHGPRAGLVWESPEKTDVRECFSILNAYHLPGNGAKSLYPDISPVNSFRVIFNNYFGANFELLPDHSFFSKPKYLYKFFNVTDRVKKFSQTPQ